MIISESIEKARVLLAEGKFEESLHLLEGFYNSLGSNQFQERTNCLNEQSACLWRLGQYKEAELLAQKAIKLTESYNLTILSRANALNNLGAVNWFRGELDLAEDYYKQSLSLRRKVGDSELIANSLNNLGLVNWQRGNFQQAERYHKEALKLFEEIRKPQSISMSLNNLGVIYRRKGMLSQAEEYFQGSYTIREESGNIDDIAITLTNLGLVNWQRGELNKATQFHERALELFEEIGNSQNISMALVNLGKILWQQGKYEETEEIINRSLKLREEIGNLTDIAESRYYLLQIYLIRESFDEAESEVNHLENLNSKSDLNEVKSRYYLSRGLMKFSYGDLQEATKYGWQAKKLAEEIPHFVIITETILFLIQVHLRFYLLSEEEHHKKTCESLLNSLLEFAKREHLHGTYIESLLIQGLLKRADYDLLTANTLFTQAELLADERGFQIIAHSAREEQNKLQKRIDRLKQAQKVSPDTYKKIQLQEVLNYIQKIQKSIDM